METKVGLAGFKTGIFLIYLSAWLLQAHFFLNGDVSYYLHAASLLLKVGSYTQDFFNPNPPLVLFLYLPALLLTKLGFSVMLAFRIYIFLLASISLSVIGMYARRIFAQDKRLSQWLLLVLAIIFLILPFYHLGQRDQLLIILTLPYLFLKADETRLNEKTPLAILVGLLAFLGFAMKPQFLLTPLLVAWVSPRASKSPNKITVATLTLLILLLAYGGSIFLFYPDYLSILPFILRNYYPSVSESFITILFYPPLLFSLGVLVFSFLHYLKNPRYARLQTIWMLSLFSFLIIAYSQRTTFFYHAIPALSLALLLLSFHGYFILCLRPRKMLPFLPPLLLLLYALPAFYHVYAKGQEYKSIVLAPLYAFMQTQKPHTSIYVFARWGTYTYPVVDYSQLTIRERYDCLWPLNSWLKAQSQGGLDSQQQKDKKSFIEGIAEDLTRYQPNLILVDSRDQSLRQWQANFDFVSYFSDNANFKKAWRSYDYLTSLDEYPYYRLDVYQRRK